ncbi:TPA-induced transmembrane protein homolog isoform X2 [Polyodon spathula]|uniref:TPA-induced transmembrane protein homolog isoform X2 n=1 Tax=Polyodon spathula TaxID=7913 RepID=UPI001B7E757A|nr:TPA-induced transmembrane protein homolog isoform X2 [Polyodon spathula]
MTTENTTNGIALIEIKETEEATENSQCHVMDVNTPNEQIKINRGKQRCRSSSRYVFWKCKLWMLILSVFILLTIATVISLVLYSVVYVDEDEKIDKTLYVVPRYYNGTLRIVNQEFTRELLLPKSQKSEFLSGQLKDMLSRLYSSSPALGRYFVNAGLNSFSNGSVTAYYWLKFEIPSEHSKLIKYTLSEEVLVNVFRQHLYDQELDENRNLHIDPSSLSLQVADGKGVASSNQ